MVPVAFEYHRAGSVAEALSLMAQHGEDAKSLREDIVWFPP